MIGIAILIGVAALYVALNVRRVLHGRRWAFTFCQAVREFEQQERARTLEPPPGR